MQVSVAARAISGTTHLLALLGIAAYAVTGALMPPAAYVFYGVLALNGALLILWWGQSPQVRRHIVQAMGIQVSVLLTELLALVTFVLGMGTPGLDMLRVSLATGRLITGPLAGWNPEVLITWALAPFFLGMTAYAAWRGYAGQAYRYPLIGGPLESLCTRDGR